MWSDPIPDRMVSEYEAARAERVRQIDASMRISDQDIPDLLPEGWWGTVWVGGVKARYDGRKRRGRKPKNH